MNTFEIIREILEKQGFKKFQDFNCFYRQKPYIGIKIDDEPARNRCKIHLEMTINDKLFPEKIVEFTTIDGSIVVSRIDGDKNAKLNLFTINLIQEIVNNPHRVKHTPPERHIPDQAPACELIKKIKRKLKSCRLEFKDLPEGWFYLLETERFGEEHDYLEVLVSKSEETVSVHAHYTPVHDKNLVAGYSVIFSRDENELFSPEKATFRGTSHWKENPLAERIVKYIQATVFD